MKKMMENSFLNNQFFFYVKLTKKINEGNKILIIKRYGRKLLCFKLNTRLFNYPILKREKSQICPNFILYIGLGVGLHIV